MEYDFSQLNDKEFEVLAVDLLEKVVDRDSVNSIFQGDSHYTRSIEFVCIAESTGGQNRIMCGIRII